MPEEGDASGGQARAVQGEVVRRSQWQRAARVRGGRRAEGRAWRTSGLSAFKAWTRDRLNVRALQPDEGKNRLSAEVLAKYVSSG